MLQKEMTELDPSKLQSCLGTKRPLLCTRNVQIQKTTNKTMERRERQVGISCMMIVQMAPDFGSTMAKLYKNVHIYTCVLAKLLFQENLTSFYRRSIRDTWPADGHKHRSSRYLTCCNLEAAATLHIIP